jgi:hypothetical protein
LRRLLRILSSSGWRQRVDGIGGPRDGESYIFPSGLKRFQSAARCTDLGATPWPTSPAEIKAFRDAEETQLLPIMKAAGIKPE